jgi:hypothetical protein
VAYDLEVAQDVVQHSVERDVRPRRGAAPTARVPTKL